MYVETYWSRGAAESICIDFDQVSAQTIGSGSNHDTHVNYAHWGGGPLALSLVVLSMTFDNK